MTSKFTELAIDCADPNGLARFWCSVLDYEVQDEDDGIVTIGSPMVPDGKNHLGPVPPTLTFAHVPEGKTVKNRLHLDVNPTDREQDEEVRRLLDLGARHADVGQTGDESWVVLADPEVNEFCVLADRCRYPTEYAHSAHLDHPVNVYLRETDLVPKLDTWLARLVSPANIETTCRRLAAAHAQPAASDDVGLRAAQQAWPTASASSPATGRRWRPAATHR